MRTHCLLPERISPIQRSDDPIGNARFTTLPGLQSSRGAVLGYRVYHSRASSIHRPRDIRRLARCGENER